MATNNKGQRVSLEAIVHSVIEFPRDDLKSFLIRHWLGKQNSAYEYHILDLKDGKIVSTAKTSRKVIILVQFDEVCNAFIHVDGTSVIEPWQNASVNYEEKKFIHAVCQIEFYKRREYVAKQAKFINWMSEHIREFLGLTPEEAVKKLDDAGF